MEEGRAGKGGGVRGGDYYQNKVSCCPESHGNGWIYSFSAIFDIITFNISNIFLYVISLDNTLALKFVSTKINKVGNSIKLIINRVYTST